MADAPYLKSIPGDVKEVKENVAKFGSKMTELESQLTSLQANVGQIKTEVQKNSKVGQKLHTYYTPNFTIWDNIPILTPSLNRMSLLSPPSASSASHASRSIHH